MSPTLRRRRAFSTLLHIVLAVVAVACGGAARESDDDRFRVALLTPGPISDQSWNAGAYAGLLRVRDSLGAEVSHIQTRTPADFEENFRQYGAQRYDLVFGHGFEFQDAAERVAPQYPGTVYVVTSGSRVGANVAPMIFGFDEPSYLAGVLAAHLTRSGTVGLIGGTELPPVRSSFLAFEAGVRSVRPNARILTAYIGNWDDVSAGKEQALAQIARGTDVIFQNADAASLGIFQAARERSGVFVFGTNANQNDVAPEVVIASVVIDLPHAFLEVSREVRDGAFAARVLEMGPRQGVVELVLNPALADRVTPGARAAIDSVRAEILAGRFAPPRLEFVDTATIR
ncbi:MAG TPA: BMP family protein [Gemmatimonadaceae bacterium]|nr:BMP family protein [Gemmatimonadaceae bacterium]